MSDQTSLPDSKTWQERAAQKVTNTNAKIPTEWRLAQSTVDAAKVQADITGKFIEALLTSGEVEITSHDSVDLAKEIAEGAYTAVDVTRAFCKRAALAHQLNNCLHEIFFDDALKRAEELDEYYRIHSKVVGPLHGVPVSLKDQFHVKNVETTMGYVGWLGTFEGNMGTGKEKNTESLLVSELLSLGAVLYCKTSVPQTLLMGETHNNIIGHTMNPRIQTLSAGGSSGGEAALQALGGSCIGFGTDIGGSVRIPAAFCGTYSVKPSCGRIPYRDAANSVPGQTMVPSTIGVMSTSLSGLSLGLRSLASTRPWEHDPNVVPIPWREDVYSQYRAPGTKLCIGVLKDDGVVGAHPPILRGIDLVVKALIAAGHEVVEWEPPSHKEGTKIQGFFLLSDGGYEIHQQLKLSGEPVLPELIETWGERPHPAADLITYQNMAVQRRDYQAKYMDYWNSTIQQTTTGRPVDAVLMPVVSHAATVPGTCKNWAFTGIGNLLDYASTVIPVTRADKEIDLIDKSYQPKDELDKENWEQYKPEIYHGAPVGIQFMCRRFEEEKSIAIAEVAEAALKAANIHFQ